MELKLYGSCMQDLANRLGSGNLKVEAGAPLLDADVRSNYLANSTIAGIDRADVILLIGTNPRMEAPVFNARCVSVFKKLRLAYEVYRTCQYVVTYLQLPVSVQ